MSQTNFEFVVCWMIGFVTTPIACALMWGWPAGFIAIGILFCVWAILIKLIEVANILIKNR